MQGEEGHPSKLSSMNRGGNEKEHCVLGEKYRPGWLKHMVLRCNCLETNLGRLAKAKVLKGLKCCAEEFGPSTSGTAQVAQGDSGLV